MVWLVENPVLSQYHMDSIQRTGTAYSRQAALHQWPLPEKLKYNECVPSADSPLMPPTLPFFSECILDLVRNSKLEIDAELDSMRPNMSQALGEDVRSCFSFIMFTIINNKLVDAVTYWLLPRAPGAEGRSYQVKPPPPQLWLCPLHSQVFVSTSNQWILAQYECLSKSWLLVKWTREFWRIDHNYGVQCLEDLDYSGSLVWSWKDDLNSTIRISVTSESAFASSATIPPGQKASPLRISIVRTLFFSLLVGCHFDWSEVQRIDWYVDESLGEQR
jgi:hypothetical protein